MIILLVSIILLFFSLIFLNFFTYSFISNSVLICFTRRVFLILKKKSKSLVVALLILIMNRKKKLRTNQKMQIAAESDKGSLKMFEFVRMKCVKSSEVRLLKQEISAQASRYSEIHRDSSSENTRCPLQNLHYGVPKKRSGHRAVCNNENLWIWGGFCPVRELQGDDDDEEFEVNDSPLFPELWRFNFATRRWCLLETTGDIPDKYVASHSTILHGNSIVVFGGTGFPFGENLSNNLYICNLNTLVWKKYELKGQKPLPLYGSSLLSVGDYLYILFGTNAVQYCSNVYRVNIKTLESEKLFDSIELVENSNFRELENLNDIYPNDFLYGRYRQEVIHFENKLYTFGGGKIDGDAHSLDILPAFNVEINKWEFVPTLPDINTNTYPEKRKFHSCIQIDEYVYVLGGMHCDVENNVFQTVENCLWRLDMSEMRWQMLNIQIPCLTYFHAACANQKGQVFIHGGVKSYHGTNTRINHLYTIVLKLPKLSDICWNKLIVNYPKLLYMNKNFLFNLGIPTEFIKKIN